MIINGVNLPDIDITELETAEKYEQAMDLIQKGTQYENSDKRSQIIRQCCNGVFKAFDTIFGDGTAKKVFGKQTNLTVCLKAVDELVDQVNRAEECTLKIVDKIGGKYTSNKNREQRRYTDKKNKNRNYANHNTAKR